MSLDGASTTTDPVREATRVWRARLAPFQSPSVGLGLGQVASSILPFLAIVAAMYATSGISTWLTLALAIPAAGFVVRVFIIQHDCGHGSFFRSRRANEALGWLCSVITFTPFANWRRQHANHHAVWNNLDRRSGGADIYSTCLTVTEYGALSPMRRRLYRAVRHPLVALILIPPLVFIVLYRLPFDTPLTWRRERLSVYATDLALAAILATLMALFGVWTVLLVQLPIMAIASIVGVWLFAVQHKFDDALWSRQEDWTTTTAALQGSSYLRLPRVLQWFTGNIGFHHLHHLAPRMPNYRLSDCHRACPEISGQARPLSLWEALRAPGYALWDEARGRMVRFAEV
jgi:omega-6 fatty acid desaturase (delta-12 desaturase)